MVTTPVRVLQYEPGGGVLVQAMASTPRSGTTTAKATRAIAAPKDAYKKQRGRKGRAVRRDPTGPGPGTANKTQTKMGLGQRQLEPTLLEPRSIVLVVGDGVGGGGQHAHKHRHTSERGTTVVAS